MTTEHPSDEALAARLGQLASQRTPPEAVWTAVAANITASPAEAVSVVASASRQRQRPRWRAPLGWAMAASVALLAVLLMPRQMTAPDPVAASSAPVLVGQADAMAGEYRLAIASLPTTEVPAELRPALHELDASAAAIRVALERQPDAEFLLNQLRRTYAKRLELTRMAALETPAVTTT